MLQRLHRRAHGEKGFTLIELLVVILIIGILAAIAIPSFLGQRAKAQDSAAKSTAKNAQTAIETCFTDGQTYVGATDTVLKDIEPSLNGWTIGVTALTATGYKLDVTSKRSTAVKFAVEQTALGTVLRTCVFGSEKRGGCTATNSW